MGTLDSQQIEALGRARVKAALIEANLEVATPERDNGIDLIAFRWRPDSGEFIARPIQMKAASHFIFGVDKKYERIPHLILAYVMDVRAPTHTIYALTYAEAARVVKALGWAKSDSWTKRGGYTRTYASKKLVEALRPFIVAPGDWGRFFPPLG